MIYEFTDTGQIKEYLSPAGASRLAALVFMNLAAELDFKRALRLGGHDLDGDRHGGEEMRLGFVLR